MQILFRVNQTAALLRGINAPASTIKLDIDPQQLTELERQVLAAVLIDGHDATHLGIQTEPADIRGQAYRAESGRVSTGENGDPTGPLVLVSPTVEGVREAIADLLLKRTAKREKHLAEITAKQKAAREKLAQLMSTPAQKVTIGLNARGEENNYDMVVRCEHTHQESYHSSYYDLSPDDDARYKEWKKEVEQRNAEAKRAAMTVARQELVQVLAQSAEKKRADEARKAAKAERYKAQIAAKVAEVNGLLAERWAAGRATSGEVEELIRADELAARGLTFTGDLAEDWGRDGCDSYGSGPLTDEQWVTLRDWCKLLPENTEATLYDMYDHAKDRDGDADESIKRARLLVASATWYVGEVWVTADTQIGTLPDVGEDESDE